MRVCSICEDAYIFLVTIGETISHYRILDKLGVGGMGVVYRAEDTRLGRQVAIKFLRLSAENDMDRFRREARTASALSHPHICTVYDVGDHAGRPFLVMELLDGKTLEQRLKDQPPLTQEQLIEIAIQIADGLEAAHSAGIVHRDIKPANVFITNRGQAKILDFGLAKLEADAALGLPADDTADSDTRVIPAMALVTTGGMTVGTVAYMSPEQALGEPVDARSDLFSFGVVLYEMATGELPFKGHTAASLFNAILNQEPPAVLSINPAVPQGLDLVIHKALEKDRELRSQNAAEIRAELKRVLRDSVTGRRTSSGMMPSASGMPRAYPKPEARKIDRRSLLIGGAGAAAIVTSAAVGVNRYLTRRRHDFANLRMTKVTASGNVLAAVISPDKRFLVSVLEERGNQSLNLRELKAESSQVLDPARDVDYRGLTFSPDGDYLYFVRADGGPPFVLYRMAVFGGTPQELIRPASYAPAITSDGARISFIRRTPAVGEGAIIVAASDGTGQRKIASRKLPDYFTFLSFSHDGKLLACATNSFRSGSNATVIAVRSDDGAERPMTSKVWKATREIAWLPDSSGVLVIASEDSAAGPNQIWFVAYPSGQARPVTHDSNDYSGLSVAADGRSLVTVQSETDASIQSVTGSTGTPVPGTGRNDGMDGLVCLGNDTILYVSRQFVSRDLFTVSKGASASRRLPIAITSTVAPCVASQTGEILFVALRSDGTHIWKTSMEGRPPQQITFGGAENAPSISSDGRRIFYSSITNGQVAIWSLDDAGKPVKFLDRATYPAVSPDGKLLAFATVLGEQNWHFGVIPIEGGQPKVFSYSVHTFQRVRWRGNRTITFFDTIKGSVNILSQDIDGGPIRPETSFSGRERIFDFDWTPDGRLFCARGTVDGEVVMLTDF